MHTIREAHPEEWSLLPTIERAAAQLFRNSPYPAFADGPLAADSLDPRRDRVWVVTVEGTIAAFAIVRTHSQALHIQEIDVHPSYARRGLGKLLIDRVAHLAKEEGKQAVTLTTMSDVPWNGPYYARVGFELVERERAGTELNLILDEEAKAGIPMVHRICMKMII